MTLDEIADCVPLLSFDELKEIEASNIVTALEHIGIEIYMLYFAIKEGQWVTTFGSTSQGD